MDLLLFLYVFLFGTPVYIFFCEAPRALNFHNTFYICRVMIDTKRIDVELFLCTCFCMGLPHQTHPQ